MGKLGLRREVVQVGLDFQVGVGGSRLSVPQRQKLVIARGVLKRPDILILDEVGAVLDARTQRTIANNLLEEFTDRALIWILQRASLGKTFDYAVIMEEGKVVFREGEPASQIFLVVSGSVSLEIYAPGVGSKRILTIGPGDLLGWTPILEQTRASATARALSATRAIAINGGQILTLCVHNPSFGYEFMRQVALELAKRLSATRMQLIDVFGTDMPTVED